MSGELRENAAVRRMPGGQVMHLTAEQLFEEFEMLAAAPSDDHQVRSWNLANHGIGPHVMQQLFRLIHGSKIVLKTTCAIDLDGNRLGEASVQHFKNVLAVLHQDRFRRLIVRFGYEIYLPALKEAMAALQMEHVFGWRVVVNDPWPDSQLHKIAETMRANHLAVLKQMAEMEKRLAKIEERVGGTTSNGRR